jgi:hypothetical protein
LVGAASAAQAGSTVAIPANMLPQGGHFVAGAGSIGTQGLTETITQSSQRGIIDFNSFSIGKSGAVKINNGNQGRDYTIAFVDARGTITPAQLRVSAVTDSRVYNGMTSSSGTPTFGTVFGTDGASFTQAFQSKDVLGPGGSTLLASGSVKDGNGGRDYSISFVSATGTITPASLTVSAVGDSRVYNGTTSSSGTPTFGTVFGPSSRRTCWGRTPAPCGPRAR